MKIIVTFSGGKDSLASLLWVRNNLTKDFTTVFCDTGWEHKLTYKHIQEVKEKLNLNLVILKSKEYDGMIDLARRKTRFPSSRRRFCTEILKSIPMVDYILDEVNDHCLIIQGIRAGESYARSKMSRECTFFKYYLQPYKNDKKGNPKYFTYRKNDVLTFREKFVDDILRPVFNWTADQVIDYIFGNGLEPNPLYKQGMKRVGCYPCVMSNHTDILNISRFSPERIEYIYDIEKQIDSTFFAYDTIPSWATKDAKPSIKDIVKYVQDKNATGDLFHDDNEATSCLSFYGLCE